MRRLTVLPFLAALVLLSLRAPALVSTLRANLGMFAVARAVAGDPASIGPAEDAMAAALDWNPNNAAAVMGLGRLAVLRGDWNVAAGHFAVAANLGSYGDLAWIWSGQALWQLDQPQAAQASWEAAASLNFRFPIWLYDHRDWGLGVTGLDEKGYAALVASLDLRSIEAGHTYTYLYVHLSEYYEAVGDYGQVAYWLERGFKEATGGLLWVPASNLARLYKALGDYDVARYWYGQAIERSPFPRPDYLRDIGETYELEGNLQAALDTYRQALAMDPGNKGIQKDIRRVEMLMADQGDGTP